MSLTDEERQAIVVYRLEKADHAILEAKDCVSMGHWTLAANRHRWPASAGHARAVSARTSGRRLTGLLSTARSSSRLQGTSSHWP